MIRLALLLLALVGCAKPWQVARCVEWCESLKGGCGFDQFTYPVLTSPICHCDCAARVGWIVEQQQIKAHADGGAK